jgi:hypothetical protein
MHYKGVAESIDVLAVNSVTGAKVTGDNLNITAEISIDGGTSAATNDVNPAELEPTDHPGIYTFNLTAAEKNGDKITITPVSSTSNVVLDPVVLYTSPDLRQLHYSAPQVINATVDTVTNTHTPTTTEFQADDITEATTDHYKRRIVIFTSGNLVGQTSDITGYSQVGGIGQFTVNALTEAPANNDTFIII